ncbi:unnamed protein product [Schistosoma curassoni]|uniref:Uncharacterized protein n=1 Tax=Schistosoma curassoni TaxID=6186 RepID=A0A183KTU7_9TREM|nr:unnamed protein product [Schistosoma curassoni]
MISKLLTDQIHIHEEYLDGLNSMICIYGTGYLNRYVFRPYKTIHYNGEVMGEQNNKKKEVG